MLLIVIGMIAVILYMDLQIRRARLTDAAALSELIGETAGKLLKPHYSEEQWNIFIRYYSEADVLEKISQQAVFCAEIDGTIVGTVALADGFVLGFYTRVHHVGQGIGSRVMEYLEEYARGIGLSRLQLASSPVGLAFYYKHGWVKVRDIVAVHYGVGYEETLMEKVL
jgi:GNAT superfamily N-acetyltransferase